MKKPRTKRQLEPLPPHAQRRLAEMLAAYPWTDAELEVAAGVISAPDSSDGERETAEMILGRYHEGDAAKRVPPRLHLVAHPDAAEPALAQSPLFDLLVKIITEKRR